MDFVFKFPVVRGVQAKKEYYIAMVPLKMISRLFPDNEEYVLPEFRAQRKLNEPRVPVISKYIIENRDNYVFSALAASIDGKFSYKPNVDNENTGVLEVSMDAHFLINDGQHRKAAILEAIKEDESLGNETISIVFYEDKGLSRSQQIFTDLNKNAVKTSNSIAELYDSRDSLAVTTRNAINGNEFLNAYTDKEKDILGKYSSNLFTLNTFYTANRYIFPVGEIKNRKDAEKFLKKYWNAVAQNMTQWNELQKKELSKIDLRENYIATQGIVIQALGRVGRYFYDNPCLDMEQVLISLRTINWKRNAPKWRFRAIRENGRIITNKNAAILIANEIKRELGLPLSEDENLAEEKFKKNTTIK
ncbi:MAG: DNA sulfur modification protein DndB [Clostridiales bacterium]|nr:DNA sulfur modification protein DndB [Clostridiales bacterium]